MSFSWDCNRNNNLIVTVLAVTVPTREEIIHVALILPSTPFNAFTQRLEYETEFGR